MRRNRIFSTITNFIVIFAMKSVVHSLVRISFFLSVWIAYWFLNSVDRDLLFSVIST